MPTYERVLSNKILVWYFSIYEQVLSCSGELNMKKFHNTGFRDTYSVEVRESRLYGRVVGR